jgi:hypothetical protein
MESTDWLIMAGNKKAIYLYLNVRLSGIKQKTKQKTKEMFSFYFRKQSS